MHKYLPKIYFFINELNINNIKNINKKIAIIYRNYHKKPLITEIKKFKNFCKKTNRKFLISNHPNLAFKLDLDGVYIPSFNKKYNIKNYVYKKNFLIIGSAHNLKEIKIKEKQGVEQIFLSPLFKVRKNKNYFDVIKFNFLSHMTKLPIIALGGISTQNIKKIKMTNSYGFASISFIKDGNKIPNLN
tara:strand:- start:10 stop:570 length:561 start_codon:yes stop_codon:yes gene_type:complete